MSKKKLPDLPWSQPVAVTTLTGITHLHLVPDAPARQAIARFAGLHALDMLDAGLRLAPRSDGLIRITGTLGARVQPVCVVTLEPFEQRIEAAIDASFAPPKVVEAIARRIRDEKIENPDDLPDEILDGQIDPAALVVEMFILALDPYPKAPGTAFETYDEAVAPVSPFAALQALKDKA